MPPDNYEPFSAPSFADPAGDPQKQLTALGMFASAIPPISWAKNALDAFGKGLEATGRGEQDPGSALQVASFGSGAPSGLTRPAPGRLGTFIGPSFEQIQAAKVLEDNGLKGHEIWNRTGIWRGPEGEWRTEIPDHRMKLQNTTNPPTMGHLMDHPDLYGVHPEIAKLPITVNEMAQHKIAEFNSGGENGYFVFSPQALKDPSTVLHEVQHYLQHKYGFAEGGQPARNYYNSQLEDQLRPIRQDMSQLRVKKEMGSLQPNELDRLIHYNKIMDTYSQLKSAAKTESMQNYRALAGEVEARNVGERYHDMKESLDGGRRELSNYVNDYGSQDDKVLSKFVNGQTLGKEITVYRGHETEHPHPDDQPFVSSSENPDVAGENSRMSKITVARDAPAVRINDHISNDTFSDEQEILLGKGKYTKTGDNEYTFGKADQATPVQLPPWYTQDIPYKDQIVTKKPMIVGPKVPDSFKTGGKYDPSR